MAKSSEEISKSNLIGGKPDANLANDALHLNGIPADEFATEKYVQDYHDEKEELLKEYINEQNALKLQQAKSYTDVVVENQDFSSFAKVTDVHALDDKLSDELSQGLNTQKNYTDGKISALASDVNDNFNDVGQAITSLNNTTRELFTSVSNGKSNVAAAITDKGVSTASNASFDTMATNIRKIPTSGGDPDPYYVNTGDATAESNDILLGKTAYVKGEKVYGSHVDIDTSDANAGSEDILLGKSAYVNGNKIYGTHVDTGIDTSDANATPYDILVGKTAYAQEQKITGILDLSGEVPTYSSSDGVEKIYGGSSRDYTLGTIIELKNIDGILYNSRTSEVIAGIRFTSPNLSVKYIYNNTIGMTRTLDLSSILAHTESLLQDYADYSSSFTFETGFIGITRTDIHTPYFALYSSYGTKTMKEAVITLVPIKEVHTMQGGVTVVTWEIDTENVIYYPIETGNSTKFSISTDYVKYVYEDGSRIALINIDNVGKRSCVINIDDDNWTIKNNTMANFENSYGFSVNSSYVIPVASNRVLVLSVQMNSQGIYAIMFNENGEITSLKMISSDNKATVSSDLQYMINSFGNIYRLNVDLVNYNISSSLLVNYEFEDSENDFFYFIGNNNLLITGHYGWQDYTYNMDGNTYFYEFTPKKNVPLKLIDTKKIYVGKRTYPVTTSMICDTLLYSIDSTSTNSSGFRYIKLLKDYEELIALKYNGEYYYPQRGGVMTAGQGDVRAGKTFIGWMGYEETGTMEVEE